jgi:hypothetical protein
MFREPSTSLFRVILLFRDVFYFPVASWQFVTADWPEVGIYDLGAI